jgi:succinoglycan biosynthesis protein ExoM
VEPRQKIYQARKNAVENGTRDFVAFIDDDEEPFGDWLRRLLEAMQAFEADGVLGPVIPRFISPPPAWVLETKCFERPSPPTGTCLGWKQTRTGNVLLRRRIFEVPDGRFHEEYRFGSEDTDFFRRMMALGLRFVWCAEAKVAEAVPIERCSRRYLVRRALQRGRAPYNQGWAVVTSLFAVPAYALALPFIFAFRRDASMRYVISTFDHLGRILAFVGGKYWDKVLPPDRI